jgi:uncharacterized protein YaaR (DUF327 family)
MGEKNGVLFLDLELIKFLVNAHECKVTDQGDSKIINNNVPTLAKIPPSITQSIDDIEKYKDTVNAWFLNFTHVLESVYSKHSQTIIYLENLNGIYSPKDLKEFDASKISTHLNGLSAANKNAEEQSKIFLVFKKIKEKLDETAEYLRRNSHVS